jgi:hypothetical protein
MGQYNWTLLDDFGNRFKVGIYHGDRSGHVMVHCNKKIMIIDFNVLQSKKYSFFLGHEFCELDVIKEASSYRYTLKINEEVDTQLNVIRRKLHRKNMIKAAALAIAFFAAVAIITILLNYKA